MAATKSATKPKPRVRADWEAIERDYRTGRWSGQELADKHSNVVTRQAIEKRAKSRGWTKDLTVAVRQATKAALVAAEATKVAARVAAGCEATVLTVAAIAEENKDVILGQRDRARKAAAVSIGLIGELGALASAAGHEDKLAAVLAGSDAEPDAIEAARKALEKALSLPSRAATVQKLTDALAKAQAMQRQAYGLDDLPPVPPEVPELGTVAPSQAMSVYLRVVGGQR